LQHIKRKEAREKKERNKERKGNRGGELLSEKAKFKKKLPFLLSWPTKARRCCS